MYSNTITAVATAALLPLASALTLRQSSAPPTYKLEQAFGLVARVTKPASTGTLVDVEGYSVASGHVAAGEDAVVLIPSSGGPLGLTPDTYFGNGTTDEIMYGQGTVVRVPTGQYPYSWVISGASGEHGTGVDIGTGTPGVHVSGVSYTGPGFPDSQPYFAYDPVGVSGSKSQFYACNAPFYEYTEPLLFWRNQTSETPADCAEVKLLPQCKGDVANATQYTQKVYCYDNAATVEVLN